MTARTTNNPLAERVSQRFRAKRSGQLKSVLLAAKQPGRTVQVLDLGGRHEFWRRLGLDFLLENDIHVTLLNLTASEAGDDVVDAANISFRVGDACATGMADRSYDVVMSNSVIEHLVTWRNMIDFAGETSRVGAAYYCQTPNFWFPIDPHYYRFPLFHWLPRPTRAWLFRKLPVAHAGRASSVLKSYELVDAARLLTRTQMQALFPDAQIRSERVLGVFVKSLVAIRSPAPTAPALSR